MLNLTPGRSDGALLESGLHVDTYNDEPRRFATAILYLGDLGPEDGGQTVFPAAGRAPAIWGVVVGGGGSRTETRRMAAIVFAVAAVPRCVCRCPSCLAHSLV